MGGKAHVEIPRQKIVEYCQRHHLRKLAFFGSVLRPDFRSDSDVDVLVEFEPGHVPGFLRLFQLEQELSRLLGGRRVDLVTPKCLNARIRDQIVAGAEVQYAKG